MNAALPIEVGNETLAVRCEALTKKFGAETALAGAELHVPAGSVYALVGPNGAGKSTLFRVLLDLLRADSGTATVFGMDPVRQGPSVRAQIGYVADRHEWGHRWMPIGRLIRHHEAFFPSWDRAYAVQLAHAFDLRLDRQLARLSKGQARRVHLMLALAHRPPLLLLDEPTEGLDPVMQDDIMALLVDHIAESESTVVISTHRIHEVDRFADYVGVIRGGRLLTQLSRDSLRSHLRRYVLQVPESWPGAPELGPALIRSGGLGKELVWVVWGEEPEVVAHLVAAGAVIREVAPLSLEDATLSLLRSERLDA